MTATTEKTVRGRGRPRDQLKREAVIDAARRLFIDAGVDAVTMDQIVSEAGVSRAMLWGNFPDKANIVEAVIGRESDRMIALAGNRDHQGDDLEATLSSLGDGLLRFLYDPDMMAFERIIGSASRTYPDLVLRFYDAGPGRYFAKLSAIIADACAAGSLSVSNADQAASDLVGLWQGIRRAQTLFRQIPQPNAAEISQRVRHGVRQFMRLYALNSDDPV